MATSPLRILSASSSGLPPPQTITVMIMAWPSQAYVTASVTSYPPAVGFCSHTAM